jgi:hypothetical protein
VPRPVAAPPPHASSAAAIQLSRFNSRDRSRCWGIQETGKIAPCTSGSTLVYHGVNRNLTYQLKDTTGGIITIDGLPATEVLSEVSSSCASDVPIIGSTTTQGGGKWGDSFNMCNSSCLPADANLNPTDSCTRTLQQVGKVNGYTVINRQVVYTCTTTVLSEESMRILKICTALSLALFGSGWPLYAASTTCSDNPAVEQLPFKGPLHDYLIHIAELYGVSVVAELNEKPTNVDVPGGQIALQSALGYASTGYTVSCTGDTVRLFTPAVLKDATNPLNHKFAAFVVPADADGFVLMLKQQLKREGQLRTNPSGNRLNGGYSGFVGLDTSRHALRQETVENISARDLLLREASQANLIAIATTIKKGASSGTVSEAPDLYLRALPKKSE